LPQIKALRGVMMSFAVNVAARRLRVSSCVGIAICFLLRKNAVAAQP